jgi:hypothetical protein
MFGSPSRPVSAPVRTRTRRRHEDRRASVRGAAHPANVNPDGRELDRKHLGRTNWQIVKTAIDQKVNVLVGRRPGERHWLTQPDLVLIQGKLDSIIDEVKSEALNGAP